MACEAEDAACAALRPDREGREPMPCRGRGDPDVIVGHRHDVDATVASDIDRDGAAGRRELDRVAEQIPEHLPQAVEIAVEAFCTVSIE